MRSDNPHIAFDVVLSTVLTDRESHPCSRFERVNLGLGVVDRRLGKLTRNVSAAHMDCMIAESLGLGVVDG